MPTDSLYLTAFQPDTMSLEINLSKYVLRISSRDAKTTVEEEIRRIESRRIVFRRQIKKRLSDLTDQVIQDELDKFKCARETLQNRMKDHNEILDEMSICSLLFYKNHRCLPRKGRRYVTIRNTQIIIQKDSAALSGFELPLYPHKTSNTIEIYQDKSAV